ncbi:hypothetical protein SCLCIDRAFT_385946 [Scleroderma citrinum Foug A]|uniref:Uncharacterized protein n=1 Tax=Scleroderma citrinum Foug A TaxID=1036808 RepID=A0A0C2YXI9_9AGAM|nr:hypothetical protein SCLCIDRAFT_385946 [Scleroderma citrinum Foug A]
MFPCHPVAQHVILILRYSTALHLFPVGPEIGTQSQYLLDGGRSGTGVHEYGRWFHPFVLDGREGDVGEAGVPFEGMTEVIITPGNLGWELLSAQLMFYSEEIANLLAVVVFIVASSVASDDPDAIRFVAETNKLGRRTGNTLDAHYETVENG